MAQPLDGATNCMKYSIEHKSGLHIACLTDLSVPRYQVSMCLLLLAVACVT